VKDEIAWWKKKYAAMYELCDQPSKPGWSSPTRKDLDEICELAAKLFSAGIVTRRARIKVSPARSVYLEENRPTYRVEISMGQWES
jgi:hypothetical protein